jgi:hypothetical protein
MKHPFVQFLQDVGFVIKVERDAVTLHVGGKGKVPKLVEDNPPSDDSGVTGESPNENS